jgi:membrane protein DedA with SNARE-associated domain
MLTFFSLIVGTLVSEDLACIAAGLLVQQGELGAGAATAACAIGIFAGDVGLWALGRFGGRLAESYISRLVDAHQQARIRGWLCRHAGRSIIASRFLPGSRLPLYVTAGALRVPVSVFSCWALVATLAWTPLLVLSTAYVGEAFVARASGLIGFSWPIQLACGAAVFMVMRKARSGPTAPALDRA